MQTYIDEVIEAVKAETHIKSDRLAQMYALLVLTKGEAISLKDVHDAWAVDMNSRPRTDHCYGHDHKSIVPFSALPDETRQKDQRFVIALKRVAANLKNIN